MRALARLARIGTLVLFLGACSGESVTGPKPSTQADPLLGNLLSGVVETLGAVVNGLLTCSTEQYASGSAEIGPRGGTITMGQHTLTVPRGALAESVRITAEVVSGNTNSVRLSPHGLQFAQPATLVLAYGNCRSVRGEKLVAYVTEDLSILEGLASRDDPSRKRVTTWLDHFSRYAVAW